MTTDYPIKSPRKLIEVALPLDAINVAAAREKSIRHGHPSTLHLWWARRSLAADISAIRVGKATKEYQDEAAFYKRTYIAEGMGLLLTQVAATE
jgi:adenine-specific DNA methylase